MFGILAMWTKKTFLCVEGLTDLCNNISILVDEKCHMWHFLSLNKERKKGCRKEEMSYMIATLQDGYMQTKNIVHLCFYRNLERCKAEIYKYENRMCHDAKGDSRKTSGCWDGPMSAGLTGCRTTIPGYLPRQTGER